MLRNFISVVCLCFATTVALGVQEEGGGSKTGYDLAPTLVAIAETAPNEHRIIADGTFDNMPALDQHRFALELSGLTPDDAEEIIKEWEHLRNAARHPGARRNFDAEMATRALNLIRTTEALHRMGNEFKRTGDLTLLLDLGTERAAGPRDRETSSAGGRGPKKSLVDDDAEGDTRATHQKFSGAVVSFSCATEYSECRRKVERTYLEETRPIHAKWRAAEDQVWDEYDTCIELGKQTPSQCRATRDALLEAYAKEKYRELEPFERARKAGLRSCYIKQLLCSMLPIIILPF